MASQPIVLGLYGCVDYLAQWSDEVMAELVEVEQISVADLPDLRAHGPIGTRRELLASILAHMRAGVGGEHALPSLEIVDSVADALGRSVDLGGTPVRAARALAGVGVSSRLGLSNASPTYEEILPSSVEVHAHRWIDEEYPHLIIQYPEGARIPLTDGEVVAKRANRLIYVYDPLAALLEISDDFEQLIEGAKVFSISALNTISEPERLRARLDRMVELLKSRDDDCVAVFEDGAYHVPEYSLNVAREVGPLVDLYSMNEDEFQAHVGRTVDLDDPADVADGLEQLARAVPAPAVVVHTARWAAVVGQATERITDALLAGQALAAARVAFGDAVTRADFDAMVAAAPAPEVQQFADELERESTRTVRCVPGRVVDVPEPTTIGLGDTFIGGVVGSLAGEL